MGILIFVCIIICGSLYDYGKTQPGVMLNFLLLIWSFIVFIIELKCSCCGIDRYLANNWTMIYMAKRRATLIAVTGVVLIGLGPWGGVIGMLVIFPYGCISRYIIASHPLCGEVFITTDPEYFILPGE